MQDGDLVVSRIAGPPVRYAVLRVPGTAQETWGSREDAVAVARRFAAAHGVDLWFDDGVAWTHLARHRPRLP